MYSRQYAAALHRYSSTAQVQLSKHSQLALYSASLVSLADVSSQLKSNDVYGMHSHELEKHAI